MEGKTVLSEIVWDNVFIQRNKENPMSIRSIWQQFSSKENKVGMSLEVTLTITA